MSSYKEIVAKTVIGKAKKISVKEYKIIPEENPDTVLGCWIINHKFKGENHDSKISIYGSFDINVWYAYDDDTKTAVCTKKYDYHEEMIINLKDDTYLNETSEIIVRSLKQPTVTDVKINTAEVVMTVEKELGVEIIGDAKVKILVEDTEDDYDIIEDTKKEIKEEELQEIETVNEDFLK